MGANIEWIYTMFARKRNKETQFNKFEIDKVKDKLAKFNKQYRSKITKLIREDE